MSIRFLNFNMGKLFLIPNTLGDSNIYGVLPSEVIARIKNIKIFASENPKNTRRFLETDR